MEWHGRYRDLVAALVRHCNTVSRALSVRSDMEDGVRLSVQEFQVLECVVEFAGERRIMADMVSYLGIPQSSLSKAAKQLVACGLVERYRLEGNRKSVVLRPTEKGAALYRRYAEETAEGLFRRFFAMLEPASDESLATFTAALNVLSGYLGEENEARLVKE